ncbi:hypothetical protein RI367_007200 [Sorochytrium milnesiophthora]
MRILLVLACLFAVSLSAQENVGGNGEAHWLLNRFLSGHRQQLDKRALTSTAEQHASNQPVPPPVYATKKEYLVDTAQLPGFKVGPHAQMYAGHLPVDNMNSTEFFVYHTYDGDRSAETKHGPKDLIVWLNGGPGFSSLVGFGVENGPVNFDANGAAKHNPYGWQKAANTLWVENPTGVGFSYTPDVNKTMTSIDDVSNEFWRFTQEFVQRFPETRAYRWWITGESFAGMYVPHIAHRILENNDKLHAKGHSYTSHEVPINLVGLAIGNGAYESAYDIPVNWFDYLDAQGLLRNATYKAYLQATRDKCVQELTPVPRDFKALTNCFILYGALGNQTQMMLLTDGAYCLADGYDIRLTKCTDVDPTSGPTNGLTQYLSQPHLYNGDKDLTCNYIGQEHTLGNLTWKGHTGFVQTKYKPFKLNGKEVGEYRRERGLTSLHVYDAGHMVPYYQPEASLHMIKEFLRGRL